MDVMKPDMKKSKIVKILSDLFFFFVLNFTE